MRIIDFLNVGTLKRKALLYFPIIAFFLFSQIYPCNGMQLIGEDTHESIIQHSRQCSDSEKLYLIIAEGNLAIFKKAFYDVDPSKIVIVSSIKSSSEEANHEFKNVIYVDEYFNSGEVEQICFNLLKTGNFKNIIATSETDILRAGKLRDLFNIKGQNYQSALAFRDKIIMKTILESKRVMVPKFTRAKSALDVLSFASHCDFPLIIKPSAGYGSVRTKVITNSDDLKTLLKTDNIFNEFHQSDFDLEEFIGEEMYHVDGLVREGKIVISWPTKRINTCLQAVDGKPIGGYFLDSNDPLVPLLKDYAERILNILPTPENSGFHLELFLKNEEPIFCEIASRVGGQWINDLWENGMGINLKLEFIRAQAFFPPCASLEKAIPSKLVGGMIFPPRKGKILSMPETCNLKGIINFTPFVEVGEELKQPDSMLGHIAAVSFFAKTERKMIKRIKKTEEWFNANFKIQ